MKFNQLFIYNKEQNIFRYGFVTFLKSMYSSPHVLSSYIKMKGMNSIQFKRFFFSFLSSIRFNSLNCDFFEFLRSKVIDGFQSHSESSCETRDCKNIPHHSNQTIRVKQLVIDSLREQKHARNCNTSTERLQEQQERCIQASIDLLNDSRTNQERKNKCAELENEIPIGLEAEDKTDDEQHKCNDNCEPTWIPILMFD